MRKKYPIDLSEREWARIEKHFRVSYKMGCRKDFAWVNRNRRLSKKTHNIH